MWATPLAVVVVLLHHVWSIDDFIAKRVFLKTPASFVNLTSESWKVHERETEITIAVRFQPNTKVGQVFSLRAIAQHGETIVKLVGSLHSGYLQIDLFNKDEHSILNKPFSTHFLEQNEEHSLAVKINAVAKTLSYRLESTSEHVCEITEDFDLLGAELVPTLGGGGNAMIGCVTLVTVQMGGVMPPYEVIAVASNEVDECTDGNECSQRDCNKGRCLPLEVATCDCYGTDKSGPNCRYPARTAFVLNNDDESQPSNIRYTPWNVDQIISRITIDFRFAELDNKQGVLLHSVLYDGSVLKLFVVERNGNLLFGSHGHMNFTLDSRKEFHSIFIGIYHDSHTIGLTVDGQSQRLTLLDSSASLRLTSLLFGGAPPTNGARELGITACLKNVYVDHHDVIYMMYDNDKRVESSKPLEACNQDGSLPDLFAVGLPLFNPDPLPSELSEIPSGHGIADTDDAPVTVNEGGLKSEMSVMGAQPDQQMQHLTAIGDSVNKGGLFASIHQKSPFMPAPCEKSQDYVCRNGATCERRPDGIACICKRGFGGKYCQFVLLPRTCAEAGAFYGLPSGPTQLDVDGTRPLFGSVAVCRNGTTVVPHDMPNRTVIRSPEDPTNALFIVSYRDFTTEKLSRLIKNSGSCRQEVRYDCNNAALGFETKRTWFGVAVGNRTVAQIGRVPSSCPCMDMGCIENKKCNCDSRAISTDSGYLYDGDAGIVRVVALHSEGDVGGKLSVGPLECEGFAASGPLRFAEPRGLTISDWHGEPLTMQFRTALPSTTLLKVHESDEKFLKVDLLHGHIIRLSLANSSATVESQARINDTKWHLVMLEIANDEVRLSVDGLNAFTLVNNDDIPKGKLQLNDDDSGFTGCVRSVFINDEAIDLQAIGRNVQDVYLYCDERCDDKMCMNESECIEDFATDTAICRCRYPNVQSGPNCENDINQNSSVSFHGGFLKYELPKDALLDQTVLSFQTDQEHALILFVHDHNNNFMQLHLSEEVNLTLSLNNEDIVSSCTVRAHAGSEFGNMRWIQITIEHSEVSSTLTVNDSACSIHVPRKLAEHPVQKFINVFTDIVIIPVGLNSPANPKPFQFVFVGGVERESHSTDGSMLLRPIYQCAAPNLLGCVRGLRIGGEVVDLRHTTNGYRPSDPKLVRSGCEMGCSSLNCNNGGHCSVAWRTGEKVSCDCSRTSYAGPHCTVDEGLILASNAYFTFDVGRFLSRYILAPQKLTQTLQFAFSPTAPSTTHQPIASVLFSDDRLFEVILNRNGSVNVGIVDDTKRTVVRTFAGNFSDGHRHFFVARFGAHRATTVTLCAQSTTSSRLDPLAFLNASFLILHFRRIWPLLFYVDAVRHDFEFVADNLDLFNAVEITLGGRGALFSSENKHNYSGCVSNLDVDFGIPALHVTPITYLDDSFPTMANYSRLSSGVIVQKGPCAPFQSHHSLPVFFDPVGLPVWETNFKRLVFYDSGLSAGDDDGKIWLWAMWIIIGLMLLLLLATLAVCCCCLLTARKSSDKPDISKDEEEQPLRGSPAPIPLLLERKTKGSAKHVVIEEPNSRNQSDYPVTDMELKQVSPRSSLQSGITAYFTAQESLSDDGELDEDLDATLRDIGDENYDMQDVMRPSSFDRTSPRMSSFRQGDPTVPKDSPLYAPLSSGRTSRPTPIPVPPPRTPS